MNYPPAPHRLPPTSIHSGARRTGVFRQIAEASARAVTLAAEHADGHAGVFDSDCRRCVVLAAACGVDIEYRM